MAEIFLELEESYSYSVIVEDEGHNFAGKLTLTKDNITLTVYGDLSEGRKTSFHFHSEHKLIICTCRSPKLCFYLFDLEEVSHVRGVLQYNPIVEHFDTSYTARYAIYSKDSLSDLNFIMYEFVSDKISKWIGETNRQRELVVAYSSAHAETEHPSTNDFFEQLVNEESIGVGYLQVELYSNYRVGMDLTPSLYHWFTEPTDARLVFSKLERFYEILSFFVGSEFQLQKIKLENSQGDVAGIYYPQSKKKYINTWPAIFFPLGHNLMSNQMRLPNIPQGSFSVYFNLSDHEKNGFKKYIKYRSMEAPEDRYLGYFRILESLCYKKEQYFSAVIIDNLLDHMKAWFKSEGISNGRCKGLINILRRANNSKKNTAQCMADFFESLPAEFTELLIYGKDKFTDLSDLRNNITHVNPYDSSEDLLIKYTKFIEVCLVTSLLLKLKVEIKDAAAIVQRISGFHLVKRSS